MWNFRLFLSACSTTLSLPPGEYFEPGFDSFRIGIQENIVKTSNLLLYVSDNTFDRI